MSAGLPFYPERLTAAAVIGHPPGLDRLVKRFLIHISQHQDLLCLKMLYHHRDQALFVRLELGKLHDALKGSHLDILCRALFLKCRQVHISPADILSGQTFHTRTFQDLEKFSLIHRIRKDHTGNIRYVHNGVQIQSVHEHDLAAALLNLMLMLK